MNTCTCGYYELDQHGHWLCGEPGTLKAYPADSSTAFCHRCGSRVPDGEPAIRGPSDAELAFWRRLREWLAQVNKELDGLEKDIAAASGKIWYYSVSDGDAEEPGPPS